MTGLVQASECTWFPGWHGPDCGCELRPVLNCIEPTNDANIYRAHWGYKTWCRPRCRRPDFITQSVGWGNRFLPSQAARGQPTVFCTQRESYDRVFSTLYTPFRPGNGQSPVDMWLLGHRIALVLPNTHKTKVCSSNHGNHNKNGGNDDKGRDGHHDGKGHGKSKRESTEFYDADSIAAGPEYLEGRSEAVKSAFENLPSSQLWHYDLKKIPSHRIGKLIGFGRTGQHSSSMNMNNNGAVFSGRTRCSSFSVAGITTVPACFNVTSPELEGVYSGCTTPIADANTSEFFTTVDVPVGDRPFLSFEITVVPQLPGTHTVSLEYHCTPPLKLGFAPESAASSLTHSVLAIVAAAFFLAVFIL